MAKQLAQRELPPTVIEVLQTQLLRVTGPVSALRFWNRVLTDEDRQQLGGNFEAAYHANGGAIGMWMFLHEVSQPRAIADVAKEIGFIGETDYGWLLREIGGTKSNPSIKNCIEWAKDSGRLSLNGETVRKVRPIAANLVYILDAFQKDGWPRRIDDPLPGLKDSQRLRETIRTLNRNLKNIRFHADDSGAGIYWESV